MTIKKNHVYNILFFGFLFFLLTPYGLGTRAKLTQGLLFVKGLVISPSELDDSEQNIIDINNVQLSALSNASDTNLNALNGKVVFINHWATWCPPCRAEMPSLHSLYEDYADKIEFVFLTTDPKNAVDAYYKSKEFKFPTYKSSSPLPAQINTTSLPATFILDKEGKLVLKEFGPADWNTKSVRKMLDELVLK